MTQTPTQSDVETFVAEAKKSNWVRRKYQHIALPYGYELPGKDRAQTLDALPADFEWEGQSVLDVGTYLGAVAFAAEERGAHPVVALECAEEPFELAKRIAWLKGSDVDVLQANFEFVEMHRGWFDIVLALNLVHHFKYPVASIHKLAGFARKALVVEFPTIHGRFANWEDMPDKLAKSVERWPVMGVGESAYYYSVHAMKSILRRAGNWSELRLIQSPMAGYRKIILARR